MKNPRTDDLLNRAIDNALDPAEREELKQLLERDPRAAEKLEQLRRMTRDIEDLGQVDPPAGLVKDVMTAVSAGRTNGASRAEGGMGMARKVMMGLAAAAAIVLGVFSITGYPPLGKGTEGSIDAAKRYQSEQIAAKDVVLGDTAVQQFLQSDVFDRLMRDESARKLLTNARTREAFAGKGVALAMSEPAALAALRNEDVLALFGDPVAMAAFNYDAFREGLGDAELVNALTDTALVRALSVEAFVTALQDQKFALEVSDAALNGKLNDALFLKNIANVEVRNILQNQDTATAFSNRALALRLRNQAFVEQLTKSDVIAALRLDSFNLALKQHAFVQALGVKAFNNVLAVHGVRLAIADTNFEAAMKGGALEASLKYAGFEQALTSSQFDAALARIRY